MSADLPSESVGEPGGFVPRGPDDFDPFQLRTPGEPLESEWRRPHPYTLIIELVESVQALILPIAFLLFQGGNLSGESILTELLPAIAILLPIGTSIARYFTTRYAVTPEAVHLHFGVLKRNKQVLPRRNIQNLSTQAGLIARATGLQELTVSDASQGGDIRLRLLSEEDAGALMTLLRRDLDARRAQEAGAYAEEGADPGVGAMAPPPGAPVPAGAVAVETEPIYALNLPDLLKHRLLTSTASLLIGVALLVGIIGAPIVLIFTATDEFGVRDAIFGLAPGLGMVAIAFAPVFQLGGFRLWSEPDRLRIRTGLLTEVQMSARRDRIQMVQVDRHIVARRFGLEAVRFETADVEIGSGPPVSHLAPAVAVESWQRFASDALGEVELGEHDLRRVSPLTQRRSLVRFGVGGTIVFAVALAVVLTAGSSWMLIPWALLLVFYVAFALWFSARRARRLGWAVGEDQFLFRNGVVGEKLLLVRKEKLQTLRIHQSFFQRRLGLATLSLGTAGLGLLGSVTLPDLERDTADRLLEHLADASAATPLSRTL